MNDIVLYTKKALIDELIKIKNMGWIENIRNSNVGGIGNTLEKLLGIEENNLPIPNAAEWELKCKRLKSTALTTLFHMEPSPRAIKFVPAIFLPNYGWPHKEAGNKHPESEMSFRQTISCRSRSDRGFKVKDDQKNRKFVISFDRKNVSVKHEKWLNSVKEKVGLDELTPQPYWGYDDLCHKAGTKLPNCFFVSALVKTVKGKEYFHYSEILMLEGFSKEKFIDAIKRGDILIDFDARTGHNHGTKFRFRSNSISALEDLYELTEKIG